MFDLRSHTHLLAVAGSRAYGLHTPESDIDLKGVALAPRAYHLGFAHDFAQADSTEEMAVFEADLTPQERTIVARTKLEGSVYGLAKFARLAIDCNPHVLDVLFCRTEELRICTPLGQALRDRRQDFLSMRARHSFGGYAAAQLKRIHTHRKWLLDPPTRPPTRADFGLPEQPLLPKDQLQAAIAAIRKQLDRWEPDVTGLSKASAQALQDQWARSMAEQQLAGDVAVQNAGRMLGLSDDFVGVMVRERQYRRARQEWRSYKGWGENRNPERAALEAKYGYDTKHGAHLVRLLTMALEIVRDGVVQVWRESDGDRLRGIRAGEWDYDRLIGWVDDNEAALAEASKSPAIPAKPDRDGLDALIVDLTWAHLS